MGWDRKRRGAASGYFYHSVRTPTGVKKIYYGRDTAGQLAASLIEQRKQIRNQIATTLRADRAAIADAELLADELFAWSEFLLALWLVETGHHFHRGVWRKRRG